MRESRGAMPIISTVPKAPINKKSKNALFKTGFPETPCARRSATIFAIDEGIPVAETVKSRQ